MPKKLLMTGFFLSVFIAVTFVVAKKLPCQAAMTNCSTAPLAPAVANKSVPIDNYTRESVQKELDAHKRVVLFFQASWCSTCYQIENDFQIHASQMPSDVVISRVNIDTNKDLKTKYHVVAQDEMVEINQNWKEISHWKSSERAVEELLINLK